LKAFSESVDRLLRDERMTEPDAPNSIASEIAACCAAPESLLDDTSFDEDLI
jgi:hypothetical protein